MSLSQRIKTPTTYIIGLYICYILYTLWEQFLNFGGGDFDPAAAASYFTTLINQLSFLKSIGILFQLVIILVSLGAGLLLCKPLSSLFTKDSISTRPLLYLWNAAVLFVSYNGFKTFYSNYGFNGINLSPINILSIALLTLAGAYYIYKYDPINKAIMNDYKRSGGIRILYYIILGLIAFMGSGEYLFLSDTEKAWTINAKTLTLFIMFIFWIRPFVDFVITLFERRRTRGKSLPNTLTTRNKVVICALMIVPLTIYFFLTFPAIFSVDSLSVWNEIYSGHYYNAAFPLFVQIMWKFLYSIWPNVAIVTLFQCVLWVIAVYKYLILFSKRGMKTRTIYVIAFITCSITPFNLFVLVHSTNFYYTIAMLWIAYHFICFFDNDYHKIIWPITLSIMLSLLPMTRNEGTITLALIALSVGIYTINKRKLLPIIAVTGAILLSLLVKGPLFNACGVSSVGLSKNEGINTLVNDIVLATIHFDGKLSDESRNILNRYATEAEIKGMWRNYDYDSYAPSKLFEHINNRNECYYVAKDAIIHNIPIAIRQRLNKSENVWNITQHMSAVNARRSVNSMVNENPLYKLLFRALYYPTFMVPVLDVLFYRSGIYICLMLIMSLYWFKHCQLERFLIIAPAVAHTAVLLLSVLWLCARHTWCISLTVLVLYVTEYLTTD